MELISETDIDLAKFLLPPDQWPNFTGYLPLSKSRREIRLLKIFFIQGTQDICASIKHASLQDIDTEYEALSYSWGPPDQLKPIWINGQEVLIRASLHAFLSLLCCKGQPAPVWVDAICINQQDVQERNWQVGMMGDIYSYATCTNVWLGEPNSQSEYCLSYLQHCDNHRVRTSQHSVRNQQKALESLEDILRRPYWTRLWIVQEITLAREVVILCGQRRLLLGEFVRRMQTLVAGAGFQQVALKTIEELHTSQMNLNSTTENVAVEAPINDKTSDVIVDHPSSIGHRRAKMQKLEERVEQFKNQKCEDVRDKIFALKSIASDGEFIEVDYRKNIVEVLLHLVLGLQDNLFSLLDTAASLWNNIQPPASMGFEMFFTTKVPLGSTLLQSSYECRLEYSSTLIRSLITWAADFEQTSDTQHLSAEDWIENHPHIFYKLGNHVFVPSRPDDWPGPDDIVCHESRNPSTLLGSAYFVFRLESDERPQLRILGCLIDENWFPLVVKSQSLHKHWTRKQIQICRRMEPTSPGRCTMNLHYGQEALLFMMGFHCIRNPSDRYMAIKEARFQWNEHPRLDICACEPNVYSTEEIETFRQMSKQQSRGWQNYPGKLPRVREASERRARLLSSYRETKKA